MSDQSQSQSHGHGGPLNMGVFFSPPETTKPDTFSSQKAIDTLPALRELLNIQSTSERVAPGMYHAMTMQGPLSPPVSPCTKDDRSSPARSHSGSTLHRDPLLFPSRSARSLSPHQPLIQSTDLVHLLPKTDISVIDSHTRARNAQGHTSPRPSRDEYQVALSFRSRIVARFNLSPRMYIDREADHLDAYPPRFPQVTKSDASMRSTHKRRADDDEDEVMSKRQRPRRPVERQAAPRRVARPLPRDSPLEGSMTAPVKHRRNPSSTTAPKDKAKVDRMWQDIPDYSPPVSSILAGTKLRIDWKGAPFDLSSDPDRAMIADTEVELVSVLRLTCAQYLRSKRSIFEKYIEDARIGKAFNKTAAQGVCQMDVNKASRLYLAFEKVGWFDRHHFQKHLKDSQ